VTKHTLLCLFYLLYLFYLFYTKEGQKQLTPTPAGQPCSSCKERKSTRVSSTLCTQKVLTPCENLTASPRWRYRGVTVPGTVPQLLMHFYSLGCDSLNTFSNSSVANVHLTCRVLSRDPARGCENLTGNQDEKKPAVAGC
jgi:hypothetical protein